MAKSLLKGENRRSTDYRTREKLRKRCWKCEPTGAGLWNATI